MLQGLAHRALWVWVQDRSIPRHGQTSKVSLFVLHHGTKSTLPHTCPPDRTSTPSATMGKIIAIPIQDDEELTYSPAASSSAAVPSSGTCSVPSTSIGLGPRGNKGGPSWAGSSSCPHGTHQPTSSSWTFRGEGPSSSSSPISTSSPHQKASSSSFVILYGIGTSHRGGISKTL